MKKKITENQRIRWNQYLILGLIHDGYRRTIFLISWMFGLDWLFSALFLMGNLSLTKYAAFTLMSGLSMIGCSIVILILLGRSLKKKEALALESIFGFKDKKQLEELFEQEQKRRVE